MTEETLTVTATKTFTEEISEAATAAPEKRTRLSCSDYLTTGLKPKFHLNRPKDDRFTTKKVFPIT